jgi:hypothetical protein
MKINGSIVSLLEHFDLPSSPCFRLEEVSEEDECEDI